jgi:hypothetical protein
VAKEKKTTVEPEIRKAKIEPSNDASQKPSDDRDRRKYLTNLADEKQVSWNSRGRYEKDERASSYNRADGKLLKQYDFFLLLLTN